MQRILVAGATGYLGGFVAREFKRRGHFVRALARSPHKLDSIRDDLDEIVQGEVTVPGSISQVCDGIDTVFSSVGITRQKDKLSFRDVDYQGNKNLLDAAKKARVRKFIYISVYNGRDLRHLDIIDAHECFVDDIKASGMEYTIVRPTGYFSDMEDFLSMAKKGRVFLIGSGGNRMNPIHGADLAEVCAGAIEEDREEIDVGGPELLSYREVAQIALEVAGQPRRITCVPLWLMTGIIAGARIFSRHQAGLLSFFAAASTTESAAPAYGTHTLRAHFQACLSKRP